MPDPATPARLAHWRSRIDAALTAALERIPTTEPSLLAAMRHAVLTGGKRLRPLLVYASAYAAGCEHAPALDPPAMAVELIHAYSLVHDDLPSMDNDALRRGQPTVHAAFGEAQAILAGDGLQALAFQLLAQAPLPAQLRIELVAELARAAGAMCVGQALDMTATGNVAGVTLAALERLHAMKTGALLRATVHMGAITAGAGANLRAQLDAYANALGLAFQIKDDLLDIEGDSATLGKTAGKDQAQDKLTFPALIGRDGAHRRLRELATSMDQALDGLASARRAPLDALAHLAIERDH